MEKFLLQESFHLFIFLNFIIREPLTIGKIDLGRKKTVDLLIWLQILNHALKWSISVIVSWEERCV